MTITVSISQFRKQMAEYFEKAQAGHEVIIKDYKRGSEIELSARNKWSPEAFQASIKKAAGVFTAKNHPEWATRAKVEKWLRETRLKSERRFDVPA